MPFAVLIALWAFARAHPTADFDAFVEAYHRALELLAREQKRERARTHDC